MELHDLWNLTEALVIGLLLGAGYFGGLLWTVQSLPASRRPALLFVVSWFLRTGVLLAGLWLVTNGDWRRPVAALTGILVVRSWLIRRVRSAETRQVGGMTSS